jgi:mRNA-degrading endonuclease RelE of RelBE toxin-antitoxin system
VEKLTDTDLYRVRVGAYRIIYDIEDGIPRVLVLKVGGRNGRFIDEKHPSPYTEKRII